MKLNCSDKSERIIADKEYARNHVKKDHMQKKLKMIEKLVEDGYIVVNDKLFVKY